MLTELQAHCLKKAMPPEIQRLGRTIQKWFDKITNFHLARATNGPTEALNNLIKGSSASVRLSATSRTTDPAPVLRRQTQLARPRLDRRSLSGPTPPESDDPILPLTWSLRGDSNS